MSLVSGILYQDNMYKQISHPLTQQSSSSMQAEPISNDGKQKMHCL